MALHICFAFLMLLASLPLEQAAASASTTQSTQEWNPLNMDPAALDLMLGEVRIAGPQVLSLDSTPYRSEGTLEGCGYAYQVLIQDWAYRSNQPVIVYGSIVYFLYQNRPPFLSQRIGLTDVEQRENRLWQRNASVHYAYLTIGNTSTARREDSIIEGEDGVKVFTYLDPELEMLGRLVPGDTLTIAFNRQENGTDLEFDLPVADYSQASLDFAVCLAELLSQAR